MGRERPVRVLALGPLLHGDAGEGVGVLGDEGDVAQADVLPHHAQALGAGGGIVDALEHHVGGSPSTVESRRTTSRLSATSGSATTVWLGRFTTKASPLVS